MASPAPDPADSRDAQLAEIEREAGRVLPPPEGHPRFPLFDPLRAIAALCVLMVHVGAFSGGFRGYKVLLGHLDIGVPFFFLLSGFLLYRPFVASRQQGLPKPGLVNYGRNRFFRIMPAYWAALTITAIVPGMYGAFTGNWWVYYGLLQNYPVYTAEGSCALGTLRCAIPPAWTLAVEVFFYIVLPFFAIGMGWLLKAGGKRRWLAIELGVLTLLSAVSFVIQATVAEGGLPSWLFFSPLGRAWWFAAGMGLAVISVAISMREARGRVVDWIGEHPGTLWTTAILIYVGMTLFVLDHGPSLNAPTGSRSLYVIQYFLVGVIAILVVLPAIFRSSRSSLPQRVLEHPVMVWLGLISYGIFLWHYPVIVAIMDLGAGNLSASIQLPFLTITTLLVTIPLAALSYYLIERPLILWSRRRGKPALSGGA